MILLASVTRASFGLPDLNINDHTNYIVAGDILGAQVTWRRQVVKSPFVESAVTVNRVRDIVEDKFAVDVKGDTQTIMQNNVKTLIDAFTQDTFNLLLVLDGASYNYSCETCDYSIDWSVPRMHSRFTQVKFGLRRSPVPISGV